jgi:hypothetical protein
MCFFPLFWGGRTPHVTPQNLTSAAEVNPHYVSGTGTHPPKAYFQLMMDLVGHSDSADNLFMTGLSTTNKFLKKIHLKTPSMEQKGKKEG